MSPHGFPFRLVDAIELDEGRRRATFLLSSGAFFVQGAAWPITLVAEALAQATLALAGERREDTPPRLIGLDRVRLRQLLRSGDRLRVEVEEEASFGALRRYRCRASRAGALAAEAEVTVSG